MKKILAILKGKKTYLIASVMMVLGALQGLELIVIPECVVAMVLIAGSAGLTILIPYLKQPEQLDGKINKSLLYRELGIKQNPSKSSGCVIFDEDKKHSIYDKRNCTSVTSSYDGKKPLVYQGLKDGHVGGKTVGELKIEEDAKLPLTILLYCGLLFLAGCSTSHIKTPTGWEVKLDRGILSTSFDRADISVDPNTGGVHVILENYKSDAQQAMELAAKSIGLGAVAGATVAP